MQLSHHRLRALASASPAFDISVAGGTCRAIAALLCLLWLLAMIAATWGHPGSIDPLLSGLWATQSSLIVLSCLLMQSGLAEAQRVLHARVAPRHALAASVGALHRLSWQVWAIAALPLLLDSTRRLALNTDLASWTQLGAGPAWLALLMLVCTWLNAAWQGRLPRWAALASLPAALLVLQPEAAAGLLSGKHGAPAAWITQALVLLLAPRLVQHVLGLPQGRSQGIAPLLHAHGLAWLGRFKLLDARTQTSYGLPYIALQCVIALPWINKLNWDAPLSLGGMGLRLLLLSMLALFTLQCHQLHWRHLIAPRGAVRQQLGRHIALATLQAYVRVLPLLGLLAGLALTIYLLATPNASLGTVLLQYIPPALWLALDMVLATVLAVLLRGWLDSQRLALFALLPPLALGLLGLAWAPAHALLTQAPSRDGLWALLELGLLLALLPGLGRAWRGVDLGALMLANEAASLKSRRTSDNLP